uniref:Uncharacterized protein n=1 Tax=Rhizophora mucronata TaxID=61149 RepID=A0A2P2MX74_RHIMU
MLATGTGAPNRPNLVQDTALIHQQLHKSLQNDIRSSLPITCLSQYFPQNF